MLDIAAEALQEIRFKDRGRRAQELLVEFTDIDYIDVDLYPGRPAHERCRRCD